MYMLARQCKIGASVRVIAYAVILNISLADSITLVHGQALATQLH